MNAFKKRPTNLKIESALLVWWKIICIEMVGNSCWKHPRDYKAVITLTKRFLIYAPNENLQITLTKMEDYFSEHQENNIDWTLLEKVRVIVHNYLLHFENGQWNPAVGDLYSSFTMPEQWGIQRIRELTDS